MSNESNGYGSVAKVFHWASALFIFPAMAIGLWWIWTDLDTDYGWEQFEQLIGWHANFGFTVIIVMLPRLVWRLFHGSPETVNTPTSLARMAYFAHGGLYALAIVTPLSGWLGSALDGATFSYLSVVKIPPVFGVHPDLASLLTQIHVYASWLLISLVVLHLLAVLYHQFWLKDSVLDRMR